MAKAILMQSGDMFLLANSSLAILAPTTSLVLIITTEKDTVVIISQQAGTEMPSPLIVNLGVNLCPIY